METFYQLSTNGMSQALVCNRMVIARMGLTHSLREFNCCCCINTLGREGLFGTSGTQRGGGCNQKDSKPRAEFWVGISGLPLQGERVWNAWPKYLEARGNPVYWFFYFFFFFPLPRLVGCVKFYPCSLPLSNKSRICLSYLQCKVCMGGNELNLHLRVKWKWAE